MFSQKFVNITTNLLCTKRAFHSSIKSCYKQKYENPITRTIRVLANDVMKYRKPVNYDGKFMSELFPTHADIVIIGAGAMGSSIAYWLKHKTNASALKIVVLEKDPTYAKNSTVLSVGGLRQQFSLPENIQMSVYGAEFIRTLKERFGDEADVNFTPHGYLILASEQGAEQLVDNSKLQRELGAVNTILSKENLKARFPWMDVTDVEVGCLGLEKEGWFDPWSLLNLLRTGAKNLDTRFLTAEAVDFLFSERNDIVVEGVTESRYEATNELVVKLPNGEHKVIEFAYCVIAAGAESADIAAKAKIGTGPGMLSVPLPVEKRKRYVYRFDCQGDPPGINTPMTIDYTGTYFRRDGLGGAFICGLSPCPEDEPSTDDLTVDHKYFDEKVWPLLAKRVPAFNTIKVQSSWGGFYEYNYFDENGIIGPHPYYTNIYIATGFSGHGIQQAPAVGRAIAELILDGQFKTINLTRLGFDRLLLDKPMNEVCIY